MKKRRFVAVLLSLAWQSAAQTAALAPRFTFDIPIQQQVEEGASVESLVVRNSHLYLVCSSSRESVVIETDSRGAVQNTIHTGFRKITSFDVDDRGYLYVLSDDSWLTVFYPSGGIQRTAHLEPKVLAFALVGGKPMVAEETNRLHFLEQSTPRFTLEAWPRPWKFFGVGSDRLAIWRPEGRTISLTQMEDGFSIRSLDQGENYIAVAADADMHLYLLSAGKRAASAQIHEYDDHLRPRWIGRLALPEIFHPKAFGIAGGEIYLADISGKAAVYSLPSPSEKALVDDDPEILTNLTKVQDAIKQAGYKGKVSIELVVETDGSPRITRIHGPATLSNHPDVIAAIQAIRFRPKIQAGLAVATPMTMEFQ